MGLEALFDEPRKSKPKKIEYEKGKDYCCVAMFKNISDGIKYFTEQIDDTLVEYS